MRQENSDLPPGTSSPAHRIREARERRGLTQAALAGQLGVARPMIAQWETGARHPWMSTLKRLAEALGVTYEWLAFGEEASSSGELAVLDPELLAVVQEVVAEVFRERNMEIGGLFFFQIFSAVYAVAHRVRMKQEGSPASALRSTLRESVLHLLTA